MKMRKLMIIAPLMMFVMILVSCGGSAQQMSVTKSFDLASIPVPEIRWEPPVYSEFDLENGITGLVIEDNEVPLVDFYFSFPAPFDPIGKEGISEMAAWTLRNGGSVNISGDSLNNFIEYKGARLNVFAGQETVYIYGLCLKQDLDLIMGIARELVDNPAYPPQVVEFKRNQTLEGIRRQNDNPGRLASREMNKLVYKNHPKGQTNTTQSVNSVTRDDMIEYHTRVFQPKGTVFGLSGDITPQYAEQLTRKHFGNLVGKGEPFAPMPQVTEVAEPGMYYAYKDVNQAYVVMGHQSVDYKDPRRHAAEIMNYILGGGGFQSILMRKIRVDQGLAYGVGSRFTMPSSTVGIFRVGASTRLEEASRTLNVMEQVITDYQKEGPTAEQFDAAKEAYLNSYVWDFESSEDYLGTLVYLKREGLPLDTPQRDLAAYQALTLEQVQEAAKELLHPDRLIKVVIGDKDKMDQPLESFGKVNVLDISVE